MLELSEGCPRSFDAVLLSSRVDKLAARLLRFLLLLGGDIERNPGPSYQPRGAFSLNVGFEAQTAAALLQYKINILQQSNL